ncbi:hypothetical protein BCT31_21855 [Vibrio lentus]|nr:hypothetical protein BCU96_17325 [Vibrio lentus]PMH14941.1 hypothetical protein BCU76_15295 [Vibrio lentus]PMJ09697.1 hypothetical protein BCU30_23380 [Vibrio lentus]PMK92217.1 hypothetical protein BCT89_21650 [Vibrio lentus]PMN12530.1 hypothetical protein BCT39_24285 [Vibrio lentus]
MRLVTQVKQLSVVKMNSSKILFRLSYAGLWLLLIFSTLSSASEQSNFQQQFSRESESFQNQLDEIVRDRAFPKKKGETLEERLNKGRIVWKIDVDMSVEHPIEKWDAIHIMPQLMFYYWPTDSLYTMDFNGTNVRRFPVSTPDSDSYYSFIVRSPNGRFLYAENTLYDLKTDQILATKKNTNLTGFSSDNKHAYIIRKGKVYRLDLFSLEEEPIYIAGLDINSTFYFKIDDKKNRLFWDQNGFVQVMALSSAEDSLNNDESECRYEGKLLSNAYTKFVYCEGGKDMAIRSKYDLIEQFSETKITIQNDKWYAAQRPFSWVISRHRTSGESGLFDTLHYDYYLHNDNYIKSLTIFKPQGYVSEIVQQKMDVSDFSPYFPPNPTMSDYRHSHSRQFKQYEGLLKSSKFSAAE